MAPSQRSGQTQQPGQLQHPVLDGAVAAALAAGGATVAGLAPAAAGAAAPAGLALTAAAIAKLTQEMIESVAQHGRGRVQTRARELREFLAEQYPERPRSVVDQAVTGEYAKERTFLKKMRDRLEKDLPKALAIVDADERRSAVRKILEREQRYLELRELAMADRSVAHMERVSVKEMSPKGAFWKLSPYVKEHTPDCLALGEKFWPWSVLDEINPPTHHGCRCALLTLDEAVERDYMDPEHADVVDWSALRKAKELLKEAKAIAEVVTLEEFRSHLTWLEEEAALQGAMVALYPSEATRKALAKFEHADQDADAIHLTLVFLGPDASELDDKRDEIRAAVARAAASSRPLKGRVAGIGMFAGDGDGERPLIATADVVGLNEFRARLIEELGDLLPPQTHGFTPHITLAYVSGKNPPMKLPDTLPLTFDRVWLVWAGDREAFKLGEKTKLEELYIETLHPRDRLGKWSKKLGAARAAVAKEGVIPERAFEPGDASPAHPSRAEWRMRSAAAILESHTEIPDAVLLLPREHERRKELLAKLVSGDVERAYKEFSMTPVADMEILHHIEVSKHPVQGQAVTNMVSRDLTMGSTSNIGDFRHELGHALRASMAGAKAPYAHTSLTNFAAAQYEDAKKRVAQSIATHQPKPKSEPEWEEKIGVADPRALDNWEENFAEQYRIYHRALYQSTQPDAPAPYTFDTTALDRYRKLHPDWARFWDAWYTSQLLSRGHDDPNAPLTESYEERLHPRGRGGRWVRRMYHIGAEETPVLLKHVSHPELRSKLEAAQLSFGGWKGNVNSPSSGGYTSVVPITLDSQEENDALLAAYEAAQGDWEVKADVRLHGPVGRALKKAQEQGGLLGFDPEPERHERKPDAFHVAFHDVVGGLVYRDTEGNYRYRKPGGKPGGPVAEWSEAVKAAFPNHLDFVKAANDYIRPVTLPLHETYSEGRHPRDRRGRWRSIAHIAGAHPHVELAARENDHGIELSMIRVKQEQQRHGLATAALDDLLDYADEKTKPVYLTPDRVGKGMSKTALKQWYASRGFVKHSGRHKDYRFQATMVRPPAPWWSGHVMDHVADRDMDLGEAAVRRYPRGTHEGGQFMPRVGAHPHPLSQLKRALLRELVPELPRTPKQRRHIHREYTIDGRQVRVPEQRTFDRTFGQHRYVSPAGTTELTRDGAPFIVGKNERTLRVTPTGLKMPGYTPSPSQLEREDRAIADAARIATRANLENKPSVLPAQVGDDGWTVDNGLRQAGYHETGFTQRAGGLAFSYIAPDGVSRLDIVYSKDARVIDVDWTPRPQPVIGPRLDRPPRSLAEFTADLSSYARRLAVDHDRRAVLSEISFPAEQPDHTGEHKWDGQVVLGGDIPGEVLALALATRTGRPLTPNEQAHTYMAYQAAVHEMLHAANPMGQNEYDLPGMALEEALTEELSHAEVAKMLRRQGLDEVVQWAADHPDHPAVFGTYPAYRDALDQVLTDARIAPELREQTLEQLKWMPPNDRQRALAQMVARGQSLSLDDADHRVKERILGIGQPDWETGGAVTWRAVPQVVTPTDPQPRGGHEVAGVELEPGTRVTVNRRIRDQQVDGNWATVRTEGTVMAVRDAQGGWVFDVDYGHGQADYSLLPQHVVAVHQTDTDAIAFGQGGTVLIDGEEAKPGDVIRYNGRHDNKLSEGRIVRVVRADNPQHPNTAAWVIEAIAGSDSLRPGQRVWLTPGRVGNRVELVRHAAGLHGEGVTGQRVIRPLTLETKALVQKHFRVPVDAAVVPLSFVTSEKHPRPSQLRALLGEMADPATRLETPSGRVEAGRVVVSDGAVPAAAERMGLTHLPVRLSGQAQNPWSWWWDKAEGAYVNKGEGGPQEPRQPVTVDARKLRGGELVADSEGREWRVTLSGTNKKPTVTLTDPKAVEGEGDSQTFPEADLPKLTLRSKWTPPPPPKPIWDDSGMVRVTGWAGGSNGARIGETATGERWLVKDYRGDQDRVATELLSNAVYRKLGVKVPEAGTLSFKGKPALAYPMLDGEIRRWQEPNAQLGEGFMADALLANWDVIGLTQDNVLWQADTPIRLDQGGTLQFRAQGAFKPFGPVPSEVWTMSSPKGGQAFGTMLLDDDVKKRGARKIGRVLTGPAIDELVDAAPFKSEKMRDEVREALKARVAWMRGYARGDVDEPKPLEAGAALDAIARAQSKLSPRPEQDVALQAFAHGWDAQVNDHLRSGAAKQKAAKEVRFIVGELDSLLSAMSARTPVDVVAYAAVTRPGDASTDVAGKNLLDNGYLGLALDAAPALETAEKTGGAVARVVIPEGSQVLLLPTLSEGMPVQPELLLPRGTRLRILRANDDRSMLETVLTDKRPTYVPQGQQMSMGLDEAVFAAGGAAPTQPQPAARPQAQQQRQGKYQEQQHPRAGKGSPLGGQFVRKPAKDAPPTEVAAHHHNMRMAALGGNAHLDKQSFTFPGATRVPELEAKLPTKGIQVYATQNTTVSLEVTDPSDGSKGIYLAAPVVDMLLHGSQKSTSQPGGKQGDPYMPWAFSIYTLYHEMWHAAFNEDNEQSADLGALAIMRDMMRSKWGLSEKDAQKNYELVAGPPGTHEAHTAYHPTATVTGRDPLLGDPPLPADVVEKAASLGWKQSS